ncbi:hypothetical protein [Lacticaseibacillus sharpeae]|jgi:microcompartment protein CcmK/EutM|uniref:hypothetical protein n=1 Tax=Lacticaseibacillus sharpeae TaxID=1626 RepID=UPI0006D23418|nr:hypothetical protein [Lacticaseibacillus sharpeae]
MTTSELLEKLNSYPLIDALFDDHGMHTQFNTVDEAMAGGGMVLLTGAQALIEEVTNEEEQIDPDAIYIVDTVESIFRLNLGRTMKTALIGLEEFFAESPYVNGDDFHHMLMPEELVTKLNAVGQAFLKEVY